MRLLPMVLKALLLGIVAVLAVVVGRHLAPPDPAPPPIRTESFGASVTADSIRALRAAILRHISGPDSYLPRHPGFAEWRARTGLLLPKLRRQR